MTNYLGEIDEDQELFIDYLCLSYPINKVKNILIDYFDESLENLQSDKLSRKSSKKSIKNNKAFCLICRAIKKIHKKSSICVGFYSILTNLLTLKNSELKTKFLVEA